MRRGLVIGKFLPVHQGHIALIRFAAGRCDELIVSMSYRDDDPIPADLRLSWLKTIFSDNDRIRIHSLQDDFDNEAQPWPLRTKTWSTVIRKKYPPIDFIFSSEDYGQPFADNLGITHIPFDPGRRALPVSASLIRQQPFRYWSFIPDEVRPYFVKRICFYGPESTGKSVMAEKLAEIFDTEYVPEVAREMISSNDFTITDIIRIGQAQTERVLEKTKIANKVLFCDTDLITTQIYSQRYLGQVPRVLYDLERKVRYDQYFLFDIDVPWISDGLRDLGNAREEMFQVFRSELEKRKIPYTLVQGTFEERERFVTLQMQKLFSM